MIALRKALVALVNGDGPQGTAGTIQNLCGRTTNCLVDWRFLQKAALPVIGVVVVVDVETPQAGFHRDITVQFTCLTDQANGGMERAYALEDRLRTILTQKNLAAQVPSADAAPVALLAGRDGQEIEGGLEDVRKLELARRDLDVVFNVKLAA